MFFGPFEILSKLDDNYECQNLSGRREIIKRHTNDLTLFKERENDASGETIAEPGIKINDWVLFKVRRGRANAAILFHGPFIVREIVDGICKIESAEQKGKFLTKPIDELILFEGRNEAVVPEQPENDINHTRREDHLEPIAEGGGEEEPP